VTVYACPWQLTAAAAAAAITIERERYFNMNVGIAGSRMRRVRRMLVSQMLILKFSTQTILLLLVPIVHRVVVNNLERERSKQKEQF
jgi:hypothetical protein